MVAPSDLDIVPGTHASAAVTVGAWCGLRALALALALLACATVAGAQGGRVAGAEPDVLRAAVFNFPALHSVDAKGQPSGFSIDLLEAVARTAGMTVRYEVFPDYLAARRALQAGQADVLPSIGIIASRDRELDFSLPVQTIPIVIFVRSATTDVSSPADLVGSKVAVVKRNVGVEIAATESGVRAIVYATNAAALSALVAGEVDAMIYPEAILWNAATQLKLRDRIKVAGPPLREVKRGIAVRNGNGALLERLNPAIAQVVSSDAYSQMLTRWYVPAPTYWTAARVATVMGATLLALLVLLGLAHYGLVMALNRRLAASEARYMRATRGTHDAIWDWNVLTGADYLSPSWLHLLGYQEGELAPHADTFTDLLHPEDRERSRAAIQRHFTEQAPYDVELRLRRKDGEYLWVRTQGQAERDVAGNAVRMAGTLADIAAEKAARDELAESEARYRMLIEQAADAIFIADENGRYQEVNPAGCELLRYSRAELLQLTVRDVLAPEELRDSPPNLAAIRSDAPTVQESTLRRKDGSTVTVEISAKRLPDGRLQAIARDLTERRRAEEALNSERAFSSTIFDSTPALVIVHDRHGRVARFNQAVADATGYRLTELQGQYTWDTLMGTAEEQESVKERYAALAHMTCEEALAHFGPGAERVWRTKDGQLRTIAWTLAYLPDAQGRVAFQVASGIDITERKQAEQALLERDAKLNEAQRIAQLGSWELDLRIDRLTWSDEIFRLFEIDPERFEATYDAFLDGIHPEDREAVNAAYQHSLETREPYEIAHRLLMPDGRVKHVTERCETEYGAEGEPLISRGTVQDVTARVAAEQALRDSELRFRVAFEEAPVAFAVFEIGRGYVQLNAEFCRFTGRPIEYFMETAPGADPVTEVMGKVAAMTHPDDFDQDLAEFNLVVAGESDGYRIEKRYVRPDGEVRWGLMGLTCTRAPDGSPHLIMVQVIDITERNEAEQALEESREVFSQFMEHSPLLTYIKDEQERYTYVNREAEMRFRAVGIEEWIGKTSRELLDGKLPPGTADESIALDRRVLQGGEPVTFADTIRRPDGEHHYLSVKFPINLPDGRRLLGAQRLDITDRVLAEEALRESEGRLRRAEALIRIGHFALAPDGSDGIWSAGLKSICGVAPDAEPGLGDLVERLHPEDHERVMTAFAQAGQEGRGFDLEFRIVRPDGSVVTVHSIGEITADSHTGEPRYFGSMADITDYKRAQEALQELNEQLENRVADRTEELAASRSRLEYLLGSAPAVVYAAKADGGGASFISHNVQRLLGYDAEQILAQPDFLPAHVHPDDLATAAGMAQELLGQGTVDQEYRILHKDGGYRWLRDEGRMVRDAEGRPLEVVGVWLDVTTRREAERQVAAMREQLLVQQKLATVGQLTATVSHELRNPLGTIRTSTHVLQQRLQPTPPDLARVLERIERNVARCDNIITDLLDFSRTRQPNPEPTAVGAWLRELVGEQELPPWLQVDLDLDADGATIDLDRDHFRRAVINLIENAVQAMEPPQSEAATRGDGPAGVQADGPAEAHLTVRCRRHPDRLVMTVEDTGPGMRPDVLERVFEPLYSTKTYGVGLGLPTVKQVMEQEGGGIDIASRPGHGTQVSIWLPLPRHMEGVA